MGQQAPDGRDLRAKRQTASRRVRSDHGAPPETRRPQKAGRSVTHPVDEKLARGFVLQGFDRTTDELRIELHLRPLAFGRLRALFDLGEDLGMCDAYLIDAARAAQLQDLVSEKIDTERYEFFLQRHA